MGSEKKINTAGERRADWLGAASPPPPLLLPLITDHKGG